MSAGQTAASPAAMRVHSSPTPTQPPPSTTMNQVEFGLACGSIRALRANASSVIVPRPSDAMTWPVRPTEPIGPSGRRWPTPNRRISMGTDVLAAMAGLSAGGAARVPGDEREPERFLIVASGSAKRRCLMYLSRARRLS